MSPYRNHFSPRHGFVDADIFEVHDKKPSKTVPGQDVSIAEMIRRYTRGENITVFEPVYNEDFSSEFVKLDRQDAAMAARELKRKVKEMQQPRFDVVEPPKPVADDDTKTTEAN